MKTCSISLSWNEDMRVSGFWQDNWDHYGFFWFLITEFRWTVFRVIYHLTLVVYLTCLTILPLTRLWLNLLNPYMLLKTKLELLNRTLLNSATHLTGLKLECFLRSSYFGIIMRRRSGTSVNKFVLRILKQDQITSHANESCTLQACLTK